MGILFWLTFILFIVQKEYKNSQEYQTLVALTHSTNGHHELATRLDLVKNVLVAAINKRPCPERHLEPL